MCLVLSIFDRIILVLYVFFLTCVCLFPARCHYELELLDINKQNLIIMIMVIINSRPVLCSQWHTRHRWEHRHRFHYRDVQRFIGIMFFPVNSEKIAMQENSFLCFLTWLWFSGESHSSARWGLAGHHQWIRCL